MQFVLLTATLAIAGRYTTSLSDAYHYAPTGAREACLGKCQASAVAVTGGPTNASVLQNVWVAP